MIEPIAYRLVCDNCGKTITTDNEGKPFDSEQDTENFAYRSGWRYRIKYDPWGQDNVTLYYCPECIEKLKIKQ